MLTNEKREALQSMATQLRRDVNEMTDEMIKPGDRILIFKENMSIL